jgi:hypothetical protein
MAFKPKLLYSFSPTGRSPARLVISLSQFILSRDDIVKAGPRLIAMRAGA